MDASGLVASRFRAQHFLLLHPQPKPHNEEDKTQLRWSLGVNRREKRMGKTRWLSDGDSTLSPRVRGHRQAVKPQLTSQVSGVFCSQTLKHFTGVETEGVFPSFPKADYPCPHSLFSAFYCPCLILNSPRDSFSLESALGMFPSYRENIQTTKPRF